jgi:hypothetical protein
MPVVDLAVKFFHNCGSARNASTRSETKLGAEIDEQAKTDPMPSAKIQNPRNRNVRRPTNTAKIKSETMYSV